MKTTCGLLAIITLSTASMASAKKTNQQKTEHWVGSGTMFDNEGNSQGDYSVEMTQRPLSLNGYEQTIEVHIPQQKTKVIKQRLQKNGHQLSIESGTGSGGGLDLGDGFITVHTFQQGTEHASTIFVDGKSMRILRYELKDGDVVRFYRETYKRR